MTCCSVYDRMANGDVAPKRVLKSPAAIGGVGAADPATNLIFLNGRNDGIFVFNRTAEGTAAPLRTIGGGPISGLNNPGQNRCPPADAQHRRDELG